MATQKAQLVRRPYSGRALSTNTAPEKLPEENSRVTRGNNNTTPLEPPLKGVRRGGVALTTTLPDAVTEQEGKEDSTARQVLAKLSASERKQLLDLLALDAASSAASTSDREVVAWSGAVAGALADMTNTSANPVLCRRVLAARAAWSPVQELMSKSRLNDSTVAQRESVYRLLARILVEHADEVAHRSGAPLSPKLVANCAPNIAALFDQRFPGYLRSGLAHLVVRQLAARGAQHG